MKHPEQVPNYNGESLANDLGITRYDVQAEFLKNYAQNLAEQSKNDKDNGRVKLAWVLDRVARDITLAQEMMEEAWKISEPHMREEKHE